MTGSPEYSILTFPQKQLPVGMVIDRNFRKLDLIVDEVWFQNSVSVMAQPKLHEQLPPSLYAA